MKKNLYAFLILLLMLPSFTEAQRLRARWKAYRYEWSAGIGATNFLGELGGANQIGTDGLKDLELSVTRPAVCVGMRYKISPMISLHSHLTYGQVRGDDALTTEQFRRNRNINFKSDIFELNTNVEFSFLSSREGGIYRLRGVKRNSTFEASMYVFAGVGLFHFNPKGKYIDKKWYALQPLGTEGQGVSPARSKYKRTQLCIPIGIGGRYFFNRRWGMGVEIGIRKTFTDYIDDVSKTYYDSDAIGQANGPVAAFFSDPSLNLNESQSLAGNQRGDPSDKDAYMFMIFSINYKLRTGRTNFPIF